MKEISISKWQKKIFILSWIAYASAYLSRTNLSIALPEMINSLGFNKANVGLIGSSFFWSYAIGQLINGYIGDKVKSRFFIFLGLLISSIINLVVGFSSNLILIIILWAFNGFFLSTLWGPIVKTLSFWFPHEKRTRIAVGIFTSMIGGYLFTWGLIGRIIAYTSWRWAFWIPAGFVFTYSLIWVWKMRNHPKEVGLTSPNDLVNSRTKEEKDNALSLVKLIFNYKLWLIAFTCFAQGVVKEGITLWGPTFLKDTHHIDQATLAVFSLVIPLMSLLGIMGAGFLNEKLNSWEKNSIMILMAGAILNFFVLYKFFKVNVYINVLLLGLGAALMYGSNTILLTIIPLNFAKYNKVSGVAGFLDFCSYIGAALAGVLAGFIVDKYGWGMVVILWIALAIIGVISIFMARLYERRKISTCGAAGQGRIV